MVQVDVKEQRSTGCGQPRPAKRAVTKAEQNDVCSSLRLYLSHCIDNKRPRLQQSPLSVSNSSRSGNYQDYYRQRPGGFECNYRGLRPPLVVYLQVAGGNI